MAGMVVLGVDLFRAQRAVALQPPAAGGRANARSPLAINLTGVVDWATELPFVDLFKHARAWISQQEGKPWGQGPDLELTAEGWVRSPKPGQYATTILCAHGGHPPGRYVCLYDGEGELDFANNANVVRWAAGRIELDVSPRGGMFIHLRKTNPADPVRNIRVLLPGFEDRYAREPFYPPFLKRYEPFRALRFMDWMRTNGSKVRRWEDRPKLNDMSQALRGVALEYMIELSNRLHADPWFCMPHLADDDYVRRFAAMVRERLDPSLRVYIEHSNEVWNGQFEQARYAADQGRTQKLSDNAFQAQLFYHSKRSVEIFGIWEQVFGGRQRLVRVLASQSANPWVSEQVMQFQDAYRHADALAIAPYFGHSLGSPKTAAEMARLPLDAVFERCRQQIGENHGRIATVVQAARQRKLDVIAYEGGQHLVGFQGAENNEALTRLFHAANRDPRMKDLYLEDLASWKAAGGKLFAVFSRVAQPSKWGSWGLLESEAQDPQTAPKYQAVMEFIRTTPAWWDSE
jgi:hypothetical protein